MRMKTSKRTTKTSKIHDSFESAVESRVKTVASFPGKQYLHRDAAAAIVSRYIVYKSVVDLHIVGDATNGAPQGHRICRFPRPRG